MTWIRIYEVRRDFAPRNHLAAELHISDDEEIQVVDIDRQDLRVFITTTKESE